MTRKKSLLPKPVFGLIEYLLGEYDHMLGLLQSEDPLIPSTTLLGAVRRVLAISRALDRLQPHHRRLFELCYRRKLPRSRVCLEMGISEEAFLRYRRELVLAVGQELGFILA
ncbi:MAG: hypothetical protein L5656_04540 [Thermanaeromonas sp.]|uniref:hypothetical protein n=1 Tax=Thermanaeromonas sp. TaxID=2003697 RepID=UPI00243C6AA9|nr:hypothetical protein [Thermanaeromonas sp.]MCG0277782.1 hypothetical protein [Thermanaeromonas sp.]